MKRLFLGILLCTSILDASSIHWACDYHQARREALDKDKNIMILFVNEHSTIITDSFMNQSYINMLNAKFVSVIILKNKKYKDYPIEMLYTIKYPALFFLNRYELPICEPLTTLINPKTVLQQIKNCF